MPLASKTAEWKDLTEHVHAMKNTHMKNQFAEDAERFDKYNVRLTGDYSFDVMLDYSKNKVNDETMKKLFALAKARGVETHRDKMFKGDKINTTEGKAVLHTALREKSPRKEVADVKAKMKAFVLKVRKGEWVGSTGKKITDVINIGIGGSHGGPEMVNNALKNQGGSITIHTVSNVDGAHLARVLGRTKGAESCLFIITSRNMSTTETVLNASTSKDWCKRHMKKDFDVAKHFVAVTNNTTTASEFGIPAENCFEFWDNVPGRFSIWGSVGLSVAINIGWGNWEQFLEGGNNMDAHFKNAPLEENMPMIMGLLGCWYRNFLKHSTHAILCYDEALSKFSHYYQQVDMESSGKHVTLEGEEVDYETGHILWGETGTNGQHAFHQLLHQGTEIVPADFVCFAKCIQDEEFIPKRHHQVLLSNCLAQTEVLMKGRTPQDVKEAEPDCRGDLLKHKTYQGDRPTNTLIFRKLTPYALGNLMALYEHKVFVQGAIWGINSFDRFGVDLGMANADTIEPLFDENTTEYGDRDSSTVGLIRYIKELQVFNPFA
jgi:glucose-6-phosphate isomerase